MTPSRSASTPSARWAVLGGAVAALLVIAAGLVWFFATRAEAEPAASPSSAPSVSTTPGSPPEPRADGLPAATALGVTELRVADLETVLAFYRDAVGLEVIEETDGQVLLGRGAPLVRLVASGEPLPEPDAAGLYHTAILYPDEPSLAAALAQIAQVAPETYQGSADHRVSQAFYFGDPEANGLELYVDRPRDEWEWSEGMVRMGSEPLDPNAFMSEHLGQDAAGTAVLGHVHLKVGELDSARAFYETTLGFDVVSEADGALFYSAGGYHHHLATNTWQSAGAGQRSPSLGLGSITIVLPDASDIDAVSSRVTAAGLAFEPVDGGIVVADPWGNLIRLVA